MLQLLSVKGWIHPQKTLAKSWTLLESTALTSYLRKLKRILNWIGNNASGRCSENGEIIPITSAVQYSKLVSKVSNTKMLEQFCLSIGYKLELNI